jgi:hypothetical protein
LGGMLAGGLSLLAATGAHADTIWREAESIRGDIFSGSITSPMQIKESQGASNGGFVEVLAGNNNNTAMPASGQVCYHFGVTTAGNYRVWGRVIAATTSDDSFWVKMDAGAAINWTLPTGTAWHWNLVHPNAGATSIFALTAGDHDLCVGFREDGARLDALVITSSTSYNPGSPPAAAPAAPMIAETTPGAGKILVSWAASPGATSYVIQRRQGFGDGMGNFPPFTNLTTVTPDKQTYLDTPANPTWNCYQVLAVNAYGQSQPLVDFPCADATFQSIVAEAETFSLTSPMRQGLDFDGHSIIEAIPGNNSSTTAAPANGYARYDFRFALARTVKVWAAVVANSSADDSFWVRMDFGPWVSWNNWKIQYHTFCQWDDIHNSNTDSKPISYALAAGSHTLEFAYREDGAQLDKVFITDDLGTVAPGGCFD